MLKWHYLVAIKMATMARASLNVHAMCLLQGNVGESYKKIKESKSCPTPMAHGISLDEPNANLFSNPTLYCSILRGLQYLTITTRALLFS